MDVNQTPASNIFHGLKLDKHIGTEICKSCVNGAVLSTTITLLKDLVLSGDYIHTDLVDMNLKLIKGATYFDIYSSIENQFI